MPNGYLAAAPDASPLTLSLRRKKNCDQDRPVLAAIAWPLGSRVTAAARQALV